MNIEINLADKTELEKWDEIVKSSPYGTIFHTIEWLRIAEKHTNSRIYPFIGKNGNEIVGIFPIFYRKIGLTKMVFSPPPKTAIPYMGPILIGYDQLKQDKKEYINNVFHENINKFINESIKPDFINFTFPTNFIDMRIFKSMNYRVEPSYHYVQNIPRDLVSLEKNFSGSARRNVKKAEKDGIKLTFGGKEDLKKLYNMLYERYKDQDRLIPISEDYLLDIYDSFYPEKLRIFILNFEDKIIGGGIKLCYNNKIIDWIGQPKAQMRTQNDYLHREVMRWGIENGYQQYEIIGANNPTISQFKSKFNPSLNICFNAKKTTFIGNISERLYKLLNLKLISMNLKKKTS